MSEASPGHPARLLAVASAPDDPGPSLVTSDVRLSNLMRLLHELRLVASLSRVELARRTGMAVPTVHRLISDLEAAGLVAVDAGVPQPGARLGRPPVVYRFRRDSAVVAGVDVGNETTRVAVADVAGTILASRTLRTSDRRGDLVRALTRAVGDLRGEVNLPLAGVGVGVAAAVDPRTGELRNPPQHPAWSGLALGRELSSRLGCDILVEQDDHLAALAEASSVGTAAGASAVLTVQLGKGIGVGLVLDGRPVTGHLGRFGRIARWPVAHPVRGMASDTRLGMALPTDGLVAQYHGRNGSRRVVNGLTLLEAARDGDRQAKAVVTWAAREIAAVIDRLDALVAPDVVVFGGGLSGGFDVLGPLVHSHLPSSIDLRASVLADHAVVAGAVLSGSAFLDSWLLQRLQRA